MTAYRAVIGQGRVQPGQWIAVHGCGGVGLSAVQIAAAADAFVWPSTLKIESSPRPARKLLWRRQRPGPRTGAGRASREGRDRRRCAHIDRCARRGFTFHQSFHSLRKRGRHGQAASPRRRKAAKSRFRSTC